jgi:preprotein translocase subunit SecG
MLIVFLTTIHVLVCMVLIIVVLLQHGKSADIAATFGGVGSQTAFGPRGTATVLSRVTTWCAVIFMVTSIALTLARGGRTGPSSILDKEKPASSAPAPNPPANPPAQKK